MLPASRSLLIRSCRALPRRLQLNSVSASPAGRIPLLSSTHIASQKHQMSSSASAPPLPTAGIAASTAAPAAKNGAGTGRSYADAIEALNTLQSNAAVIEAIRKSGGRLNDFAIPEMVEYLTRIGHQPSDLNALNVIHITGTKGKGSTSAFCDALLRSARPSEGAKTGLYTSPHLVAVRERIRIDGAPISEEMFARYFFDVWDRLDANPERAHSATALKPVYFRYLTLLAFHIFLSEGVQAAILEVGIGGMYDSTNIVPSPATTGISALGLDHTAVLGNTIEEIAKQKAGIYKNGVSALTVEQPPNALEVLKSTAAEVKTSEFSVVPEDPRLRSLHLGLEGAHQRSNASLALALVRSFLQSPRVRASGAFSGAEEALANQADGSLPPAAIRGLEGARWPGRCQIVRTTLDENGRPGPTWFLDGAHTVESVAICVRWFMRAQREEAAEGAPRRVFIFNCTNGRSAPDLLRVVLDEMERALEGSGAKALDAEAGASPYPLARAFFDDVLFCTNTTYIHGGSASDLTSHAVDLSDLSALTVQRDLESAWGSLLSNSTSAPASSEAQDVLSRVQVLPSIEHAMAVARGQAGAGPSSSETHARVHVLVAGSLHLVGGVMAHLRDAGALDERLLSVVRP